MIKNEFVDMESNINEEEFNKVKEFMIKSAIEAKEKNGSWLSGLVGVQLNGVDTFNNRVETLKSITVADVEKFMKDFNKQGNYRVVILDPAQ
jgi:predicted Zn-dependent peptidase